MGGHASSPGLLLLVQQGGPGLTTHPCDARGFCSPGLRSQRPELSTPLRSDVLMGLSHHKLVLFLFPPRTRQRENNLFFSTAWKLPRANGGRGKPLPSGPDTHFPAAASRETQMNGRPSPNLPLVGTGVGDHETVSDPSLRLGPGWVGSRRETGGRDSTGTDTQKVTQDGKVTGRVGSAGLHWTTPLCRLGFHAERSSP